jgi:hypothetical protein
MAGQGLNYLNIVSGKIKQLAALMTGGTPAQGGQIIASNDQGFLDVTFLPPGVGPETITAVVDASNTLMPGNFVYIDTRNTTQATAFLATALGTAGVAAKPAMGFVLTQFNPGSLATIYTISQRNTAITGLTPGLDYFLSTSVPGGITTTVPTARYHVWQYIGRADTDRSIIFSEKLAIELAG